MLKHFSICAALIAFATGATNAQQREAVLQRVGVPGTAFDIILATPAPEGIVYDLAETPDALLLNLIGGKLALGFESVDDMLHVADRLRTPSCALQVRTKVSKSEIPVAIYVVSKGE